jgi:nucleoside-diphosphate-sugar epimerase
MELLVTGATGFLGQALVRRLVEEGHRVRALGRNERAGERLTAMGATFVRADLLDRARVEAALDGVEAVIHAAALSSPWGTYREFERANVTATEYLVEAARQAGVRRFVHVSTPSLYYGCGVTENIPETVALPSRFVNHYAATKFLAEKIVERASQEGHLETLVIRPQGLIGEGDDVLVPRLLRAARKTGLPLIGDGSNRIDLTYVGNVVDALVLCLNAPRELAGRTFNISNGEPKTFLELADLIFSAVGEPPRFRKIPFRVAWTLAGAMEFVARFIPPMGEPPLTRYGITVLAMSRTLDISQAQDCLGYRPRVSVEEGLSRFARWWRERRET